MNTKKDGNLESLFKRKNICAITNVGKQTLFLVMDEFGQAMVGHKHFNKNMKSKFAFSKVCTVSDEAFGKFTLERCWESWMSEMEQNENPNIIAVKAKHTKDKSNRKFGGWNQEGLIRFSKIAELVNIERTMKEKIKQEEEYRKSYFEKLHAGIQYDSVNGDITGNKYVAYNDLGSNDKIYENNENEEKKIRDIMRYSIEHEMKQCDNDSIFNESQNIEYGQNTDYEFSHEGKNNFIYDLFICKQCENNANII